MTRTKDIAAVTAAASLKAEAMGLDAAVLPYWPVWAAAQFASTDETKGLLQFVHVWRDGHVFQIESTDGHRAFRFRLPAWERDGVTPTLWRVPDAGLLLQAKPLRKAVSTARLLTVTQELRAVFHGGARDGLTELSSVNLAGCYSVHTADDCSKVGSFPNLNQLWPEEFSNSPGEPWAFNATYLKEWFAVVEKLSTNGVVKTRSNGARQPFVMDADYEPRVGQHGADPKLELLLMPVQIRSPF